MRRALPIAFSLLAACGAATPAPVEPEPADDDPQTFAVALRLEDGGATPDETPQTRVVLVQIEPDGARTLVELHMELGACWHEEGRDGVLIAARCWWAGAGARYELVREGDAVVARRQDVDEMAEPGAWTEAGRVEIPDDAVLQVLAPGRHVSLPNEP